MKQACQENLLPSSIAVVVLQGLFLSLDVVELCLVELKAEGGLSSRSGSRFKAVNCENKEEEKSASLCALCISTFFFSLVSAFPTQKRALASASFKHIVSHHSSTFCNFYAF